MFNSVSKCFDQVSVWNYPPGEKKKSSGVRPVHGSCLTPDTIIMCLELDLIHFRLTSDRFVPGVDILQFGTFFPQTPFF